MLVRHPLRNFTHAIAVGLTLLISSCATTKETPRLVDDPDAKQESTLPWNKQQKWEGQPSQMGGMMPGQPGGL
jgi:hypothetical protein